MLPGLTQLEVMLRRDRAFILAGLALVTAISWAYLVYLNREMGALDLEYHMVMPQMQNWEVVELLLLLLMWIVMMVAMMVPSVAPLVLIFARANRQKGGQRVVGSAGILLLGYLTAWVSFSVLMTLAQWMLHSAALLSPIMVTTSWTLGGLLLMAAGIFQFSSLKRACLVHCRSPLNFLILNWRGGQRGTFVMGLEHGTYCVGCCWMLMALLFVTGVMNLLWIAAIALFVLVEKVTPRGDLIRRIAGAAMIMAGMAFVIR